MLWSPPRGPEGCNNMYTGREDKARVHKEAFRGLAGGGGDIHTQHPDKSLYHGKKTQVQMMVMSAPC